MLLGRSKGRGRYFPLPVPESRPTEPGGNEARKSAIIGHGCAERSFGKWYIYGESGSSNLVASRREMRGDLVIDFMNVQLLVGFRIVLDGGWYKCS